MVSLDGNREVSLHFLDEPVNASTRHKVINDALRVVHDTSGRAWSKDLHLMLDLRRCSQLLLKGIGFQVEVASDEEGVTRLKTVGNDLIQPRDRVGLAMCVSVEGDHVHYVKSRDVEQTRTGSAGNEVDRAA
jgi:hypothetical protein